MASHWRWSRNFRKSLRETIEKISANQACCFVFRYFRYDHFLIWLELEALAMFRAFTIETEPTPGSFHPLLVMHHSCVSWLIYLWLLFSSIPPIYKIYIYISRILHIWSLFFIDPRLNPEFFRSGVRYQWEGVFYLCYNTLHPILVGGIFRFVGNNRPNWLSYLSEGLFNHQPVIIPSDRSLESLKRFFVDLPRCLRLKRDVCRSPRCLTATHSCVRRNTWRPRWWPRWMQDTREWCRFKWHGRWCWPSHFEFVVDSFLFHFLGITWSKEV